jgi:hypothetical protein
MEGGWCAEEGEASRRSRVCGGAIDGLAGIAVAAVPFKDEGTPAGPLNHVVIGNELSCQVQHVGDTTFELFPSGSQPGSCGTFLFGGGTLFAPDFANHDGGSATSSLGATTPFSAVRQTGPTGSGSAADPFKVVTIANAGANFTITETDTYIAGSESYHTDIAVKNNTGAAQDVILYRAGDCFLQNSDTGFGFTGPSGAIGCSANANNNPLGRIEEWVPTTPGSNFSEDVFSTVWGQIGAHAPFPNACAQCNNNVDNGAGISWSFNIPAGGTVTQGHNTTFSPTGGTTPPPAAGTTAPTGPTVGPAGNPLGLPSNRNCLDKRKFTFRLRRPQGAVVDAQVFINKVPTLHKTGANITTLTIARLPNSGRFKVRIEALSANGTKLISQRTYTRCKKSKPKGKKVKGKGGR